MSSLRRPTAERYGTIDIPSHYHASQYRHVSIEKANEPPRQPTEQYYTGQLPGVAVTASYAPKESQKYNFEIERHEEYHTPEITPVHHHEEKRSTPPHFEEKVHYEYQRDEDHRDSELLVASHLQIDEDPSYILRIVFWTEVLVVVLALISAILYTIVAVDTDLWYIVLWCAFSWLEAIISIVSVVSFYRIRRTFKKKGLRPELLSSILSIGIHIDYGVYAAMTTIASLLFMEYVYLSSSETPERGRDILYTVALIHLPIIALQYIAARASWLMAQKRKEVMRNYGYLANIFFSILAWLTLLLCKFDIVADTNLLNGAVSDWYTYGNCILVALSLLLSLIYLVFHTFNVKVLQILIASIALSLSLLMVAVSGLQARQVYSLRSSAQLEGELPFRFTIIVVLGLALYAFVLAALAILKASDGGVSKVKIKFHLVDIVYWVVYLAVAFTGLLLFLVIRPYGETNNEVFSDV